MSTSTASNIAKTTIVLRNIPRTALVSDIRRMLTRNKIENVENVHLDYSRFIPTSKAFVTFTQPAFVHPAFLRLKTAQMSGLPLDVTSTGPLRNLPSRSRGAKGREDAMKRGALSGTGPDAGVRERGKNVVIWGLPGRIATGQLRDFLRNYDLDAREGGQEDICKLETPGRPTITSRYYVRTVSILEAHRLVRRLHMSPFDQNGRKYILRARVVY